MQIVVKIPEEKVKDPASIDLFYMVGAIHKGTPLPKGHDRLVEARAIIKALFDKKTIDDVPTIIEADNESIAIMRRMNS